MTIVASMTAPTSSVNAGGGSIRRSVSLWRRMPGGVLIAIAIADSLRYADPDLWGHIWFGSAVLRLGHLVLHDPYSYSAPGHIWLNHEWLSEVIEALAFEAAGVFGLKLMKLAMTAATMGFVALAEGESQAPIFAQLSVLLASALAIAPSMQFRPQIFTFALFAGLMALLARDTYRSALRLWIAIPALAIWANLHGGFIMGIAALGIYAVAVVARDTIRRVGIGHAAMVAGVTLGGIAATLATPFGFGTWRAVSHALRNPYTRIVIVDWQPLLGSLEMSLGNGIIELAYRIIPLAMMAATAIAVAISPDLEDLPLLAIGGVMCTAAFVAVRNVPLAVLAISAPLARHGAMAAARLRSRSYHEEPSETARGWAISQMVLGAAAFAMLIASGFFSNRLTSKEHYPSGAVAFMKSHDLRGNILANFLWGEYLIWHMSPGSKVFIDGRYDTVYPRDVLLQFMLFHFDQPGRGAILAKWPNDYIMLPPDDRANRVLNRHPEWKLIYRDKNTRLYAPASSPAATIPGIPIAGVNPPTSFP